MQKTVKIERAQSLSLVSKEFADAILKKIGFSPELFERAKMRIAIKQMLDHDKFLLSQEEPDESDDQDRIRF